MKSSAKGNDILKVVWQITDGEFKGRLLFDNVNLSHPNPKVVEIGERQLKAIAIAVGHPNPNRINDSTELHSRDCMVVVKRTKDEQYGDASGFSNEIKGYDPLPAGASAVTGTPTNAPQNLGAPTRRW